jgi:hypothetical protein
VCSHDNSSSATALPLLVILETESAINSTANSCDLMAIQYNWTVSYKKRDFNSALRAESSGEHTAAK